jgi:hypothetical protein
LITRTSTVPTPEGLVAVNSVEDTFTTLTAGAVPNKTELVEPRFIPVMVTAVPPPDGPPAGETFVIEGAGTEGATVTVMGLAFTVFVPRTESANR